ncbi:dipeptidase domain containing protein [Cordyceps fumosorosea ARSEF 2679]|uniref:Dipeptidase domain containing protein n=1 Tax=Cordyceps fumosorosea (strain ARSEF 2679) TaxID=1081104 RepID=A0A162MA52_CORFA|nr:dipeptidase domain containing protein [Cordyceps fumosorosea ARSEF 2679]OAA53210.1 dipeptidase domain containing protein [Cordyceps fumosorosea ARSEF 2679]
MQYRTIQPILSALYMAAPSVASYAFYVGKQLTADGAVLVGGTGEEVSSHWLQLFPALAHLPNATVTVGATPAAAIPGQRLAIPQVARTHRYLSMEYSDFEGFPAPLTNGGLNERGVAVRDVWAPNREELLAMTPVPQRGLHYADLARLVLERADSARHGVEIVGHLIRKYGYATYDAGNTHLIADSDEGWVVWEFAGGRGLCAAERLKEDEVRVLYPGYIEDFPVDFASSADHMGSENLVSFAVEQGWWEPSSGAPFNLFQVYGDAQDGNKTARDGGFKYMTPADLEAATVAMAPLTETKLMERVRDPRIADDEAGYGQVVRLHADAAGAAPALLRMWNAPTGSLAAPFLPWWLGVESVPPELAAHRYLTAGASASFLNPDFQLQEASAFAGRLFKRVLYYMCSAPARFLPLVTEMLTAFEERSVRDVEWVEKAARALIAGGDEDAAGSLLTYYAHERADKAMHLGRTMVDALDAYVKLSGGWRSPKGSEINDPGEGAETVNCLVGADPDQPRPPRRRLQKQTL